MCGRFVSSTPPSLLAEQFGVTRIDGDGIEPNYNVAPRAEALVVRERVVRERPPERVLSPLRWGLVPSWADDPKVGDRNINARAEGIAGKPTFRDAFARKRCIVPADGFYEWQVVTQASSPVRPRKQPVYVQARDERPLALAGLWDIWKVPDDAHVDGADDGWLRTFVIITTRANDRLEPIHDRMPVLLPPETWDAWLDPTSDRALLEQLLTRTPDDAVECWPVTTAVNSADNNSPDLLRPLHTVVS